MRIFIIVGNIEAALAYSDYLKADGKIGWPRTKTSATIEIRNLLKQEARKIAERSVIFGGKKLMVVEMDSINNKDDAI